MFGKIGAARVREVQRFHGRDGFLVVHFKKGEKGRRGHPFDDSITGSKNAQQHRNPSQNSGTDEERSGSQPEVREHPPPAVLVGRHVPHYNLDLGADGNVLRVAVDDRREQPDTVVEVH